MDTTTCTETTEHVLAIAEGIYCWDGPKRRATLLSAKLGRLVLTADRVLFLSTGRHDVTVGKLLAGARGNHLAAMRTGRTDGLDLSALANAGSISVRRADVRSCVVVGRFGCVAMTFTDVDGAERTVTFGRRQGGVPGAHAWVDAITGP